MSKDDFYSLIAMRCPMCQGEEFDEVVVDGARWVYVRGIYKGFKKLISAAASQHTQSFRCKNCDHIITYARK